MAGPLTRMPRGTSRALSAPIVCALPPAVYLRTLCAGSIHRIFMVMGGEEFGPFSGCTRLKNGSDYSDTQSMRQRGFAAQQPRVDR